MRGLKECTVRGATVVWMLALALLGALGGSSFAIAADPTPAAPSLPLPEPQEGPLDAEALAAIDLTTLDTFTFNLNFARAIYAEGQKQSANAQVFSKVGDCMVSSESFLTPFAKDGYELAEFASLQAVINHFNVPIRESGETAFNVVSLAAASGFNAAAVLDATWSDPTLCGVEESPLACEYRISKPTFALLMFGTNDLKSLTPEQFDFYLRKVLVQTANAGIVPIVFTFPNQPGYIEQSVFFNRIVVQAAQDYALPLVNLWRSFEPLPNQGIDPTEPTHMTKPPSGKVASFSSEDLQGGHNVHNLLALQALDTLWQALK
ncbi:MAG: hypothetical protein OHK0023_20100 [Anaerolineae bacterium]